MARGATWCCKLGCSSVVVSEAGLTPVGPNIHANKAGYEEIADTFEAIVDPR